MSPKNFPQKITKKDDFSWTKVSMRGHQMCPHDVTKCPREVTLFVHEKLPIMSTRCLPPISSPMYKMRVTMGLGVAVYATSI